MEIIKKVLPNDYELILSSDLHVGSPMVNEDNIKEMVEYVATTKNCFMTNFGDNIEAITPNDKRFAFSNTPYKTAQEQSDAVIKLLSPIKEKTLAIGLGNHEYHLLNIFNVSKYISEALGVPNGMYCYKLEIFDEQINLQHKYFFTHGNGQISSNAKDEIQALGNRKASLKNKLNKSGHADVILAAMGHTHRSLVVEPTINDQLYLTTEDGKIKQHYRYVESQNASYIPPNARWYVNNPSFMKLYSTPGSGYISYGEAAGYEPSEIGWSKVIVQNKQVVNVERIII